MKFFHLYIVIIYVFVCSLTADAQLCGQFGVKLNVYDNDLKPVTGAVVRIVPWNKDELKGSKFEPAADQPGLLEMKLFEGHVVTGNYKLFVSAPGFIETEKSISFPHCVRLSYDILLLRKKDKYRIVNGHIADDKGASVNYMGVTFTNYADQSTRTVSTDFNGNFELKLKPGDYKITFPTNYYLPLKTKKFVVPADGAATFNLGLRGKQ